MKLSLTILATFITTITAMAQNKLFTLDDLIPGGSTYAALQPENRHFTFDGDQVIEQPQAPAKETNQSAEIKDFTLFVGGRQITTDGSADILRRYADADERFMLISLTQNEGQAAARNHALPLLEGDWTLMLDADDWYAPDTIEQAVACFEHPQVDVVLFEVSMDYPDSTEIYPMPDFETLTGDEAFRMSLTWQIHGLYMVRAAIHQRYPYDETCRLFSDDNTTRLHYISARLVTHCKGVYHYRQHDASATHVVSVRRFDYLRANESMVRSLHELKVSRDILSLYENHRWLNLVGIYMFYHVHGRELTKAERRYGLGELKRVWGTIDRTLLDHQAHRKLGYRHMPTWTLFRLQEWIYFTLRGFLGKNK